MKTSHFLSCPTKQTVKDHLKQKRREEYQKRYNTKSQDYLGTFARGRQQPERPPALRAGKRFPLYGEKLGRIIAAEILCVSRDISKPDRTEGRKKERINVVVVYNLT